MSKIADFTSRWNADIARQATARAEAAEQRIAELEGKNALLHMRIAELWHALRQEAPERSARLEEELRQRTLRAAANTP